MLFAETTAESLQIGTILIGLFGGLALFLYGLEQMSDALKLIAGDGMKKVLAKLTTNRFTGAAAGAFVTAVIQSSSVTTVLVVGFISAGFDVAGAINRHHHGCQHWHDDYRATRRIQDHSLCAPAGRSRILHGVLFEEGEGASLRSHDHGLGSDLLWHAGNE